MDKKKVIISVILAIIVIVSLGVIIFTDSGSNEEQKKPVVDTEGAVLVIAGAGSGKTQVLAQKVHDILKEGKASPESILVLTFTVAAAFSMKKRIKKNKKGFIRKIKKRKNI